MKLLVQILDDDGKVLAEHTADPCQPSAWKAPAGKSLTGSMPRISDQPNTGNYELFGITFQPHVRVDRPNGWKDPIQSPENGQNSVPINPSLWGKPAPAQLKLPKLSALAPTRG